MIHSFLQVMENRLFESSIFIQVLQLIVVLLAVVRCFLYHCALVFIQAEGMVIESDFWHDYLHGSFLSRVNNNRRICSRSFIGNRMKLLPLYHRKRRQRTMSSTVVICSMDCGTIANPWVYKLVGLGSRHTTST